MLGHIFNTIEKFENSLPVGETIIGDVCDLASYTFTPLSTHSVPNNVDTEVASDSDCESSRPVNEGIDSYDKNNTDCASVSSTNSDENYQPSPSAQDLKQSLKDKIKFRRESEGAYKLPDSNLFEPQREYKLTEEEERKNQIRKERNRRSATKSRLKRIEREKNLEKEHEKLEEENARLQNDVCKLQKLLCLLQSIAYKSHSPTCPSKFTPLQSTTTSGPMSHCNVLQPTHIPLSALPDHLRKAAKLQMSGTSMKVEPRSALDNFQSSLTDAGSVNLLKRKADDDDLQQATMTQPFSDKSVSAKEADEQGLVLPRATLVNQNDEGKFGKTLPLSSSNIAPSILRNHIDQMGQQFLSTSAASTTCFDNQFAFENSRNPTIAPIQYKSEELFPSRKPTVMGHTVPSAETCVVQTINNTVTSSGWHSLSAKQILHSSATPVVTSSQSMDLTDVCNIDSLPSLDLEALTGLPYVISGSSFGQDDNSAAQIQLIKDHLLDGLDQKCSE